MNSVYHILNKIPAIFSEDISAEYEFLAKELVKSGRLRVDTNYYSNFVRFSDNKYRISLSFGYKELSLNHLIDQTKEIIKNEYKKRKQIISQERLDNILEILLNKKKRLLLPSDDLMLKLARILVQSAHPIVIRWLLIDKVEVFITYAHNIGEIMSIANWKNNGSNSGMQSTDGQNVIIYVSCGGDPFAPNSEEHPKYGNGWAAVSRMQIIAAQEIGHYADIVRGNQGEQITRHSANFSCSKPKTNVAQGRLNDIKRCKRLLSDLMDNGLKGLIDSETKLRFYDQNKISNLKTLFLKIIIMRQKKYLLNYSKKIKLIFVSVFYNKEKYMGLMIFSMIEDMLTHLSPAADVYKNSNKDVEEAIACAESLARIPQQTVKWGYLVTKETMHDLYKIYYKQVIPSLIDSYQNYTGIQFERDPHLKKKNLWLDIFKSIFCIFKKKKFQFYEIRDV